MLALEPRTALDPAELEEIRAHVTGLRTLEALVRFGFTSEPRREVVEVVVQDEYTHDVVFRWDEHTYLVFDST